MLVVKYFSTSVDKEERQVYCNSYEIKNESIYADGIFYDLAYKIVSIEDVSNIDQELANWVDGWYKSGPWNSLPGDVRLIINQYHIGKQYKGFLDSEAAKEHYMVASLVQRKHLKNLSGIIKDYLEKKELFNIPS